MRRALFCLAVGVGAAASLGGCGDGPVLSAPMAELDAAQGDAEGGDPSMPIDDAGGDRRDGAFVPPVACGADLPGPPMNADLVEAQPGYAAALAATDMSTLPDPLDYSGESALGRGVINFMLERASGTTLTKGDAALAAGMGSAVLAASAFGVDAGRMDFRFLRRGLHHHYPCSRPVPKDLTELKARYGDYATWATREIACSRPKNGPRRLRENHALGVYVAETIDDGGVRETEVLFSKLRTDGQLDFAVYTAAGELTDRSTFATAGGGSITSSAPYTCMSCHLDRASGTFSVLFPTGTGAGCR